jgi:hypothetical protein
MTRIVKRWRPQPPVVLGTFYFVLFVLWVLGGWDDYKQPDVWLPWLIEGVVFLGFLALMAYRYRRKSRTDEPGISRAERR